MTLALAACDKENGGSTPTPVDDKPSVSVTVPSFSDGLTYSWTKGEEIAVLVGSTIYTMNAVADGNPAIFKGAFPKNTSAFRAFYPKGKLIESTGDTNFTITWPESQKGTKGSVAPGMFPMVYKGTTSITKGFTINPLGGLLKFTLAGSDVEKVVLEAGSTDADYLAADVINVNSSTLNTSTGSAKTIYRTLTMTPLKGRTFESGDYYFSLIGKSAPRSINGYSLTYYKQDGSIVKRDFSNSISISKGSVFVVEGTEQDVTYDESLVSGTVTNAATGDPIKNVLVSDGMQIVKTDAKGKYSFTSDLTVSQTVFVIMPAEYEFTANEWGGWGNFSRLQVNKEKQTIDFKLTPRTDDGSSYRILLLGDPQQMSSRPHSGESWTYVTEGIKKYRTSVSVPLYQVSLGDMVTNEIEVAGMAEAYLAKQKNSDVLTFSTPGNHDHVQSAATYYDSVTEFSRWFGPYNYSFNLGKQHFIFLDSVNWNNGDYTDGINIQGITFLEKDLAYVDVNTPIHIMTHVPMTKTHTGNFPSQTYTTRMIKALAGRHVDFWYGHVHFNSQRQYTQAELNTYANGVKSIGSHIVSRCGGNWGGSSEVCRCGSPRGFIELDIKGTETHWQFHTLDSNYDHTMNTYTPGQFETSLTGYDPTALYCNVYQWDALWGTPEVWVNGEKLKNMTHVIQNTKAEGAYDPLYQHIYPSVKERGVHDDSPSNRDNMHLFKYIPGTEKKVEIRVKDRWGEEHKIETSW